MTYRSMEDFSIDFSDTEIAFSSKTDKELKKTARLFFLMNKKWLVDMGSYLGLIALKYRLPLTETFVKATIFDQFVGGRSLLETQPVVENLKEYKIFTVMDYGAEGKETEQDFNLTMNEKLKIIDFAEMNPNVEVVAAKITGLTSNHLLEKLSAVQPLSTEEEHEKESLMKRIDVICNRARERGVAVYIDAEETWLQPAIDDIANKMMARYNTEKAVVYNTFQMYRTDRLDYLKSSHEKAKQQGYILGAKLVRGAYMDKERARAKEKGYTSPIHVNKDATDRSYNMGIQYCLNHMEEIALCNATHNRDSVMLQASYIHERNLPITHPHLRFCQLFGMSDNLTFNLAKSGFKVGKVVPYGPIRDVIPYLIRRTQENTAVTGDMSREYQMVKAEMKRREL
jgi:proline dehydrogenase